MELKQLGHSKTMFNKLGNIIVLHQTVSLILVIDDTIDESHQWYQNTFISFYLIKIYKMKIKIILKKIRSIPNYDDLEFMNLKGVESENAFNMLLRYSRYSLTVFCLPAKLKAILNSFFNIFWSTPSARVPSQPTRHAQMSQLYHW